MKGDQPTNLQITLVFICICIFVGLFVSMVFLSPNSDADRKEITDGLKGNTPVEDIYTTLDIAERISKHKVKDAVRQVLSQFTTEDLLNHDYIVSPIDKIPNEDYPYVYIQTRLMDGNVITIGYFDNEGQFKSLIKRKE